MKANFDRTRSHTLDLAIRSVQLGADGGEVKVHQRGVWISKGGDKTEYSENITFTVRRAPEGPGGWIIVKIERGR